MNDATETSNAAVDRALRTDDDWAAQASALALDIAGRLRKAIQEKGWASLAFSGGSTPTLMLQHLAQEQLDWQKVYMTLVDDRCVDRQSQRSNARLLQENLLGSLSTPPSFYPLYDSGETMGDLAQRFSSFHFPFDVVHLGMGEDAHTASFFPDATNIDEMLNLASNELFIGTQSPASVEPRITWTLSALLKSRYIILQCNGAAKRRVLDTVLAHLCDIGFDRDAPQALRLQFPILAVFEQTAVHRIDGLPISIYCAGDR